VRKQGASTFDRLLIDGDWSINTGNWLWLSASAFFYSFYRVYSPIKFGQQYDPEGRYIKQFLPVLRRYPARFIYEPWKAPLEDQKAWGCVIGKDYPAPIVDHATQMKINIDRIKTAYQASKPPKNNADKPASRLTVASKRQKTNTQ